MLDWLRRDPREVPTIEIGKRAVPIVIRRLERARRLTMRLAPDGSELRVSIPIWTPTRDALAFARDRRDWIARQLASLPADEPLLHGATLRYRGTAYRLNHLESQPRRVRLDDGQIQAGGPQASLPGRLKRWLEGEARTLMAEDMAHYCLRAGVACPRLALSNARRRWGSCAADGAIRINWRLVMAPDAVRRSVVAHEVAHLVHFDHSPTFHALLGRLFEDDIAEANRWLKQHGRSLYQPFG